VLRQDPDVAMVGEIRDKQTAQIAIEAALTGHVVLSTLHTNNAASVIMRLMDMGIEPFLINAAISGALAQRLARKICDNCRVAEVPNTQEQALLQKLNCRIDTLYKGAGCDSCMNLGYKGRTGIFELLVMNNKLRSLIVQNPSFEAIHDEAVASGMQTLMSDGLDKVRTGIITLNELVRVVV
jgi:type IV pilus assembly protein PilB